MAARRASTRSDGSEMAFTCAGIGKGHMSLSACFGTVTADAGHRGAAGLGHRAGLRRHRAVAALSCRPGAPFIAEVVESLPDLLVRLLDDVAVARPDRIGRPRKRLDSLSADKAYISRGNRRALRARRIPHDIPEKDDQKSQPRPERITRWPRADLPPAPLPPTQHHRTADEPAQAVPRRGYQVRQARLSLPRHRADRRHPHLATREPGPPQTMIRDRCDPRLTKTTEAERHEPSMRQPDQPRQPAIGAGWTIGPPRQGRLGHRAPPHEG